MLTFKVTWFLTCVSEQLNGKGIVLSTKGAGPPDIHMKMNEAAPLLQNRHRINSKWIKQLNVRVKTMRFKKENIGGNLQ